MPDIVPIAPSLEPVLEAVRAPREDDAPNRRRVIGIVSRSDLPGAHERRLHAHHRVGRTIDLRSSLGWARPTDR